MVESTIGMAIGVIVGAVGALAVVSLWLMLYVLEPGSARSLLRRSLAEIR